MLGPLMVDLSGPELAPEEKEMLQHPGVGGVILFSRNYYSPEQLEALIKRLHDLREPRLLVAVDHEGGQVQRFREGFTQLPAPRQLGALYETDPRRALHLTETIGWLMAVELRSVGVDFSFAPVLDLDWGVSEVIGERAFHAQPQVVTALGQACVRGMRRGGMAATGKHFPGHGGVSADSHVAIPVDERPYQDIKIADLVPFERLGNESLAGIMPAHVIYTHVDSRPAGFSPVWLREVLRKRLHFQGAVFSDDLNMQGASAAGDMLARAEAALGAGCDMILICNNAEGVAAVLERLDKHDDPVAHMRLIRMHGRHAPRRNQIHASSAWRQAVHSIAHFKPPQSLSLL